MTPVTKRSRTQSQCEERLKIDHTQCRGNKIQTIQSLVTKSAYVEYSRFWLLVVSYHFNECFILLTFHETCAGQCWEECSLVDVNVTKLHLFHPPFPYQNSSQISFLNQHDTGLGLTCWVYTGTSFAYFPERLNIRRLRRFHFSST